MLTYTNINLKPKKLKIRNIDIGNRGNEKRHTDVRKNTLFERTRYPVFSPVTIF